MTYSYTCGLCGEVIESDTVDHVVSPAQRHFVNGHGLQHETDVEPTGIEMDEEAIREEVEER